MKGKYQTYIQLLEVILNNAKNLKLAGKELLKISLKYKEVRPFAQFMFYTCLEECGKFLLIKDRYPKSINNQILNKVGFYNHNKKIERLVTNLEREHGTLNPNKIRKKREVTRIIRENLREGSLYVDDKNGRIIRPTFTKSSKVLNNMVNAVKSSIELCEFRLQEFRDKYNE